MDTNKTGAVVPDATASAYRRYDPACLEPLGTAGAAPVFVGAESETAHVVSAGRIEKQGTTDSRDSVAAPANQQAIANHKRFSTLRARLAIAGYTLTRTNEPDGAMTHHASRWGRASVLRNLIELAAFVAQVGIVL